VSRPRHRRRWAWIEGKGLVQEETIPDIQSADFALSSLADQALLTTRQLADFQDLTGLADFGWRAFWSKSALAEAGNDYRSLLRRTQGFVIFMHGWAGTGEVWEYLPALVCAAHPRLVALVPDINGFGRSYFLADTPTRDQCGPAAIMQSIIHWVNLLGLRSSPRARQRRRVITFVGHSMGGAALFYFDASQQDWHKNEVSRFAVAPALLIENGLRQEFYRTLGVAPNLDRAVDEPRTQRMSRVVERLTRGASDLTRAEHMRVLEVSSKGTLIQTLYGMGEAASIESQIWSNFRVVLAHDDRLLNVSKMLHLLDELGLASNQVQVVWGNHYLFSVSNESHRIGLRNREIILGEILHLHELCRDRQSF
jgi:pimeloyl-ACP methyl ester carboxylesterase